MGRNILMGCLVLVLLLSGCVKQETTVAIEEEIQESVDEVEIADVNDQTSKIELNEKNTPDCDYEQFEQLENDYQALSKNYEYINRENDKLKTEIEELSNEIEQLQSEALGYDNEYLELLELTYNCYRYYDPSSELYGLLDYQREPLIEPTYEWINDTYSIQSAILYKGGVYYELTWTPIVLPEGMPSDIEVVPMTVSSFEQGFCIPRDQTDENESFAKFIGRYREAIENKDLTFVVEHMDDKIKLTFGDTYGIDDFYEYWDMDEQPDESNFWSEMAAILELGFVEDTYNENSMIGPYTFTDFPEYDAFNYVTAIKENVMILDTPSLNGNVLASIDYEIVEVLGSTSDGWAFVGRYDGTIGWVQWAELRSPIDFRAAFNFVNDTWKLDFFVAGD